MKSIRLTILLLCGLAVAAWPSIASAQNYSIDWHSIDAGGGTSSGGAFTLAGTIGEPESILMSGGSYSLEGGFWAILSVVTNPGEPFLRVMLTGTNTVVVAWPVAFSAYSLQQTADLNSAAWSNASQVPVVVGEENQVVLPLNPGNTFFRLKSQ
jgi:hypothetical protein